MWVREKRGENTENLILSRGITLPKNCLHQVVQQQIQGLTGGKKKKKKKSQCRYTTFMVYYSYQAALDLQWFLESARIVAALR